MDASAFLESTEASSEYRHQIACVRRIPARSATYGELIPPVTGQTGDALQGLGINRLYSHQARAIQSVRDGENIVVVTGTASGKTLCYNIPVIEALELDSKARALYIFPTKALAQDQLGKINLYGLPNIRAATYDGDTPRKERPFIKAMCNIVLTNPDMLHLGILPYHTTWADLFRNLKYIVIDEVHTYRGVFGAHVANVIRRLRRIAQQYGSSPQFVCASATVSEPGKLIEDLTGCEARVIDHDGSPVGEKLFVFWNPPLIADKNERRSANSEAVSLLTRLVESGIRSIVFTKARKTAELILRYARTALRDRKSVYAERIMAYRAGYTPAERREIERRLFSGELIAVTSTSALEVGVDIGGLDAVVMTGYPGSIASAWQQAGRAGRGMRQSMAALVARNDPIDQYLMRNPDYFFDAAHERAIVDYQNPYVLADHLQCAVYELPLSNGEVESLFGERAWDVLGTLEELGRLGYNGKWYWPGSHNPAGDVNIRSSSAETYSIVSVEKGGRVLGTVDGATAFEVVHPGAVYLHAGESYVVTYLDLSGKTAYVEHSEVNYYTTPGSRTYATVESQLDNRAIGSTEVCFGDVSVSHQVTHFWKKKLFSEETTDKTELDLPEVSLATEAVWIVLPRALADKLIGRGFDLLGTIHAIEHAAIGILPLIALCDRSDIGGVSHSSHPDTDGLPVIYIYDGHAGGVGISRAAYDHIEELLEAALRAIDDCACDDGCPGCIQSPKCGNNNEPLDKAGAIFLLQDILSKQHASNN
ncbi:MAG: DEAD/DEAH box helicase [Armatimonadetes bacterium]|nr:DEAD/DEAH box helicase [Armatimonadota bacterium]